MSFNPYLFFVGTCREAMTTYQGIFGGQLDIVTVAGQLGRLTRIRGVGWEHSALFDPLGRAYQQRTTLTGWRDLTSDTTYRADGSVASDTLTIADSGDTVRFTTTPVIAVDSPADNSGLRPKPK